MNTNKTFKYRKNFYCILFLCNKSLIPRTVFIKCLAQLPFSRWRFTRQHLFILFTFFHSRLFFRSFLDRLKRPLGVIPETKTMKHNEYTNIHQQLTLQSSPFFSSCSPARCSPRTSWAAATCSLFSSPPAAPVFVRRSLCCTCHSATACLKPRPLGRVCTVLCTPKCR